MVITHRAEEGTLTIMSLLGREKVEEADSGTAEAVTLAKTLPLSYARRAEEENMMGNWTRKARKGRRTREINTKVRVRAEIREIKTLIKPENMVLKKPFCEI